MSETHRFFKTPIEKRVIICQSSASSEPLSVLKFVKTEKPIALYRIELEALAVEQQGLRRNWNNNIDKWKFQEIKCKRCKQFRIVKKDHDLSGKVIPWRRCDECYYCNRFVGVDPINGNLSSDKLSKKESYGLIGHTNYTIPKRAKLE